MDQILQRLNCFKNCFTPNNIKNVFIRLFTKKLQKKFTNYGNKEQKNKHF